MWRLGFNNNFDLLERINLRYFFVCLSNCWCWICLDVDMVFFVLWFGVWEDFYVVIVDKLFNEWEWLRNGLRFKNWVFIMDVCCLLMYVRMRSIWLKECWVGDFECLVERLYRSDLLRWNLWSVNLVFILILMF